MVYTRRKRNSDDADSISTDRSSIMGETTIRENGEMKKFNKLFGLCLCALGLSVFAQSASADVVDDIIKRGELRVAVQTQGPPVSYVDTKGNRTGFAVELVQMMADDIGVTL